MNKTLHKVIFNKKRGCMMVVAENTTREGKSAADTTAQSVEVAMGSVHSAFSVLSFSVSLILGAASILVAPFTFADGIVADKTAPKSQQATILHSANGTPQVNIQTPTSAGVSVNQFSQFDVGQRGAILNNSRSHTQTQLGGWIQGNPWLAGGEARVIVNQVNSAHPSLLNGYIEVGGRRAEVVIANPAGIQVNGAGFINASRATLTTGMPQYQAGALTGFQVRSGSVNIDGQGLDTRDTDYTRILSQTAQINAPVWGKDVRVVVGQNDVVATGDSHTVVAGNAATHSAATGTTAPLFAIDTGALGGMYAGKITLISTDPNIAIRNQGQLFASAGNVAIDANGNLVNSGTIAATHAQDTNNVSEHRVAIHSQSVNNSGTIAAQQHAQIDSQSIHNVGTLLSSGELVVNNANTLTNETSGQIQAARLAIQTAQLDNLGNMTQVGSQKLAIETQGQLENRGRIGLPDTTPTASNGSGNIATTPNTPATGTTNAPTTAAGAGSAAINTVTLTTTPTFADGFIRTNSTLNNSGSMIANGQTEVVAQQGLNNTGQIDVHQLDVKGAVLNNSQAHIRANKAIIQTQQVNNQQGEIATDKQLTIQTQQISNQQGQILSAGDAELHVSGSLNNSHQGKIAANQTLLIDDHHHNTLAIDNTDGTIQSSDTVSIQSRSLANNGTISAGNRADIQLQDNFTVERDIVAGNSLNLTTAGTLTNAHALKAGQSVTLQGYDIVNQANAKVQAGQITQASALHNLINRGLFNSNGLTYLSADNVLLNLGTGKIYGNHVALTANHLTNQEEIVGTETKAAVIAARKRLDIGARSINNQEEAILSSEGDLAIGGSLDTNQHATGMADSLINGSARIEAQGNGKIAVKQLQNVNNHFKVEEYLASKTGQVRDYTVLNQNTYYQSGKDGYFDNSAGKKDQTIATFHLSNGQKINANQWHVRDYHTEIYKERVTESKPAQIIIGGHLTASGQTWLNKDSQIIAGADLITDHLENGQLINDATLGKGRVKTEGTQWDSVTQNKWYDWKKRPRRVEINYDAYTSTNQFSHNFDTPISIIEQNTSIGTNQQTAALLNNTIHSTTGNIVSLNGNTIQLPTNSLYTINPNSRGWLVETDPAFANYRQWLGSDYMLAAFKTDPNNMHKRLGDGYYEQKLINEQINRLTGFRRLDGYSNDEEQFKALMDSGLTAGKELGLTLGVSLSPEQVARLTSDIVWLENQTITLPDGSTQTVLVPKVYVLVRKGDVNSSGSLISANQINLNLQDGTLNNSGTIASRQVVVLNALDINNAGHIQADKIGLTASNNINFNGGFAQAGRGLIAHANNINLTTLTSSAGDKQNGTTVVDRVAAMYVSGNADGILALNAQKDLNLNAAAISNDAQNGLTHLSAGNNLNLDTVITEDHESSGNLSDRNHRHVHQTAEVGSQIQTQGDVVLSAGNDINIRQGTINSQNRQTAVIAGHDVNVAEGRQTLDMDISVYSKHSDVISSTKTLDQYQGHHDEAVGSGLSGKKVIVVADNDINVRGSSIVSDDSTTLSAVRDVGLTAAQSTYQDNERHEVKKSGFTTSMSDGVLSVGYNKAKTNAKSEADSITVSGSQVGSINGSTQIIAGNQIKTEASSIGAGQDIAFQAKDITLGDAYAQDNQHSHIDSKSTGFNLNINLKAPEARQLEKQWDGVQATRQTDGTMQRGRTFHKSTIDAATEQWKPAISFNMGSNKSSSDEQSQVTRAIGSNVNAAGKVSIQATEGDVNIIGSQVFSQQGVAIGAQHNVNIVAAKEQVYNQSQSRSKSFGLGDSGNFSAFIGSKTDTSNQQQGNVVHSSSVVGSGNGNTHIDAGETYNQIGSQLVSGSDVNVLAKSINISAADNPYFSDTQHTFTQKGITVGISSPIIQAIQTAQAASDSMDKVGQSKNPRTNVMAAANAGWQAYQASQIISSQGTRGTPSGSTNPAGGKTNSSKQGTGISVTITYGEQRNQDETHIRGNHGQGANIQADGKINLTATGAGKDSDIRINGTDITGKQGTHLSADDQIHITAVQQNHNKRSSNSQRGWNAGVALDFSNGFSLGVTAGGNYGKGYGNGDETTYLHNHIGDANSQTTLTSGSDTVLNGTQIKGKGVQINAKNLTIETPQDTATYRSKQYLGSAQVTVGYGFSGSADYSQSKTNADYASVTEQSGIYAGDDGYQIHVKGNTDLKGGIITSSQSAEDKGKNQISTGTLTFSDIQNHSNYEGESFGLGASVAVSGKSLGQGEQNKPQESHLKTVADKNGVGSNGIGYGSDNDSQESITKSGINTRNISITDEAEQIKQTGLTAEETKSQIHTDATAQTAAELSGSLKNSFDKDAVQKELDLQRTISQDFSKNVQQANTEINQHLDKLKEDKEAGKISEKEYNEKLGNWQRGKVLLNMIASGLSAPTQSGVGIAAATASPAVSYEIGQYFKGLAQENQRTGKTENAELTTGQETAHILAHAVLGAAVSAAGDNNVLAGALSAGGAEAAAPVISSWLYGEKDGSKLTAEQKETVVAITNLLGAATGATIGDTTANVVQGGVNADSAVENNEVALSRYQARRALLDNVADFTDPFGILAPFNAMRAEKDYLDKLRNERYRNEQDEINENIKNYLLKHGINIKLQKETVLENVNGVGKTITRLNTYENSRILSKALQEFAQSTVTNHATFRAAKARLGIPQSMQPTAVRRVPLMEKSKLGNYIPKLNSFGKEIYSTEYLFIINNRSYVIQNHTAGHDFGQLYGIGNQAAHFNIKEYQVNGKVDVQKWKEESDYRHNKQTYTATRILNTPEHLYTKPSPHATPNEPFFKLVNLIKPKKGK